MKTVLFVLSLTFLSNPAMAVWMQSKQVDKLTDKVTISAILTDSTNIGIVVLTCSKTDDINMWSIFLFNTNAFLFRQDHTMRYRFDRNAAVTVETTLVNNSINSVSFNTEFINKFLDEGFNKNKLLIDFEGVLFSFDVNDFKEEFTKAENSCSKL